MEPLVKTFIIAEIGVNHNRDIGMAMRLVDVARDAGADAVKFQTYSSDLLVREDLPQAEYQRINSGRDESQLAMLERYELSREDTVRLKAYAESCGLSFLSTPYDHESCDFLESIGLEIYKVSSGDITNTPLLKHIAKKEKTIILSTGASTLEEVREAVEALTAINKDIILLHCTSCYPARVDDMNLNAIKTLTDEFNLPVGLSDHTTTNSVSIAAVALGARVIERHITLDKALDGPDHKASLEPDELKNLVTAIREVELALGSPKKKPCKAEEETISLGRRSIVVREKITAGQIITEKSLIMKRPGTGISPARLAQVIGKKAKYDLASDYLLTFDDVE